jgi:hypothetical protein
MNGFANRALVETLESRKLLTATPFPNGVGDFTGTFVYSGGSATLVLDITKQKGASLSGIGAISVGSQTGKISGSINKKDVVHLSAHPGKATGSFVGTLTGDTLTGTLKYTKGKTHITGTVTLTRPSA